MQLAMTKKTKIEYTVSNPNDLVKFWFNVIGSVIHFFRILSTIPVWCIFASLEKQTTLAYKVRGPRFESWCLGVTQPLDIPSKATRANKQQASSFNFCHVN